MRQILDLNRWPLQESGTRRGRALAARCRIDLRDAGMFNLDALIRPRALWRCVAEVAPLLETAAFTQARAHNLYFDDDVRDVDPDHPALRRFRTVNHTICGDQIPSSMITRIYEWPPLIEFLAATMDQPRL